VVKVGLEPVKAAVLLLTDGDVELPSSVKANDAVVTGWMNSTGHRRNILGNYNEIGVAVIVNKNGEPYYCQVFGKRDK
jgi:uncharacterized protein YkwD